VPPVSQYYQNKPPIAKKMELFYLTTLNLMVYASETKLLLQKQKP
jgi:hypothetical protein